MASGHSRSPSQSNASLRFSCGAGGVGIRGSRMQPPRRPIDHQVNRNPETHNKVPVRRIFFGILEALAFDQCGEKESGKNQGVDQISQQMQHVESHEGPDRGAVGVDAPIRVQMPQFKVANYDVGDSKQSKYYEAEADGTQIAFASAPAVPLIRNDADQKQAEVKCAPEQIRRIAMWRPLH